jgi:outer membrane protein assembly factor BamB
MKQHFVKHVAIIVAGLVVAAPAAFAQTCHYSEVDPGKGKVGVGELSIDLGQGDGSGNPTAWLGPVTLTHASGDACSVDPNVSIVERPLYTNGKQLLVSAYSGSEQNVYAIDAATCKVLWKSESFSGRVKLTGNRLQLGKHRVKLGEDCTPAR